MADLSRKQCITLTDQDLLTHYRVRPQALIAAELVERYRYQALGRCYNLMGKENPAAEDCYQEAVESFLTWLSKREKVHHLGQLWYTLTTRRCIDCLRKDTRNRSLIEELEAEHQQNIRLFVQDPDNPLLEKEENIRLVQTEQLTRTLPTLQRESIELFYFHKRSYRQIAEQLQLPLPQVKSALQNGKRRLRNLLLNR